MATKTFITAQRGRMVDVKIDSETGWITFHYPQEGNRKFYSIPIKDWVYDKTNRLDRDDNWHKHMMEKNWFSEKMADFINKHCK